MRRNDRMIHVIQFQIRNQFSKRPRGTAKKKLFRCCFERHRLGVQDRKKIAENRVKKRKIVVLAKVSKNIKFQKISCNIHRRPCIKIAYILLRNRTFLSVEIIKSPTGVLLLIAVNTRKPTHLRVKNKCSNLYTYYT